VGEEGGHLVFFFVYLGEFNCVWRTRINWGYILWYGKSNCVASGLL
jgi:hypothetical protein